MCIRFTVCLKAYPNVAINHLVFGDYILPTITPPARYTTGSHDVPVPLNKAQGQNESSTMVLS